MAFGVRARQVAERLPDDDSDLIVADPSGAHAALVETYGRRARGKRVRAMAVLDDASAALSRKVSHYVISKMSARHERLQALAAFTVDKLRLAGQVPAQAFAEPPQPLLALMNFLWLSGDIVVRSQHERRSLFGLCGNRTLPISRRALHNPRVPATTRREDADRIVVWAPDTELEQLGPLCLALQEVKWPVTLLGPAENRTAFDLPVASLDDAADVLAHARLIIDTSIDAPDSAHALARNGAPLMVFAPFAYEPTLEGAIPYQPENTVLISAMIRYAITLEAPQMQVDAKKGSTSIELTPKRGQPSVAGGLSLIMPTCDRPEFLRRALASVQQQSWPDVEVLVVNDGQIDVSEVVAAFSRARLVPNPHPGSGPSAARNLGLAAARGDFIGFLDDDDRLFPDHAARMITALERSGADYAQCDVVACFAHWTDDGRCMFESIEIFPTLQDLRQMDFTCLFVLPSLVLRRSLLADERFDESLHVCEDYDLWMRLMRRAVPCYQPVPTAAFVSWRNGGNNSNLRGGQFHDGYATVYARYPVSDPMVVAQREKELARLAENAGRPSTREPVLGRYLRDAEMRWLWNLEALQM